MYSWIAYRDLLTDTRVSDTKKEEIVSVRMLPYLLLMDEHSFSNQDECVCSCSHMGHQMQNVGLYSVYEAADFIKPYVV